MKRSKKTFLTCLLSLVMLVTCGIAVGGLYGNTPAVMAEDSETLEVSATHVKTTTLTGQNWEGYVGNDGYLVYAGQDENGTSGKYVYSDLYGETYENKSLYKDNYINTKTAKTGGSAVNLVEGAPISLWGVGSETWQYNKDMKNAALTTPSGVTYADTITKEKALCPRINNSKGAERAVSTFARVTEDNLYVTVYLMNYGNKKGTFYLDVYKNTIRNADNSNGTISVPATANDTTTVADYFGAENKLESLTIAHNQEGYKAGYFVTFKLEKAGDYQFVAYTDTGVTINFYPSIGGMFFDTVEPFTGAITYELDGGENNVENPARYAYGVGAELKAPTKEGYAFDGWYDNAEFSGEAVTAITATQMDDVTLYAKFTKTQAAFSVERYAISLDGKIGVYFYTSIADEYLSSSKVRLTDTEGSVSYAEISEKDSDGYYVFGVYTVPKYYDKDVSIQLVSADGNTELSEAYTATAKNYCDYVIGEPTADAELKNLCQALKDYCEGAKMMFIPDYEAEQADVSQITKDSVAGYQVNMPATDENVTLKSFTLVLETDTALRIGFAYTGEGLPTVKIGGEEIATEDIKTYNGGYYIEISDIVARDLGKVFTVEIDGCKIEISAMSYVYQVLAYAETATLPDSQVYIAKVLYAYFTAADAYFNSAEVI